MPNSYSPIVFDPTNTVNDSLLSMQSNAVGGCAQFQTPIVFNGALYWIGQRLDPTLAFHMIQVWTAPLDGSSWTLLDGASSPHTHSTALTCGAFVDPVTGVVTVAYMTGNPSIAGGFPLLVRTFDLTTGLWGALIAPGGPNVSFVDSVFVRSDASIVVFRARTVAPAATGLAASIWNGAWVTVNMDTNATAASNTSVSACIDPATDTIHCFMRTAGQTACYQQIDSTNTLGTFRNFTAAEIGAQRWQMTNPIIVGGFLLFAPLDPTDSYPMLLIGTPLNAPVFTFSATIDPTAPTTPISFASLAYDGTHIFGVYILHTSNTMRLCYTANLVSPGTGWQGEALAGTSDPSNYNIQFQQVGLLTGDPYGSLFVQFEQSLNYISNQPNVVGGVLAFTAFDASISRKIDVNSLPVCILPSTTIDC